MLQPATSLNSDNPAHVLRPWRSGTHQFSGYPSFSRRVGGPQSKKRSILLGKGRLSLEEGKPVAWKSCLYLRSGVPSNLGHTNEPKCNSWSELYHPSHSRRPSSSMTAPKLANFKPSSYHPFRYCSNTFVSGACFSPELKIEMQSRDLHHSPSCLYDNRKTYFHHMNFYAPNWIPDERSSSSLSFQHCQNFDNHLQEKYILQDINGNVPKPFIQQNFLSNF